MDDGMQGSGTTDRPDPPHQDVATQGRERSEGRAAGIPEGSRHRSDGRPSAVRDAQPHRTPPAEEMPTEDPVEQGATPPTEHQPGGDL